MERSSYVHNRSTASLGKKIAGGDKDRAELSLESAALILLDADIGRRQYTAIRKTLKSEGFDVLPRFELVNKFLSSVTPPTVQLKEPYKAPSLP